VIAMLISGSTSLLTLLVVHVVSYLVIFSIASPGRVILAQSSNETTRNTYSEIVIGRKKREARPFNLFREIYDAINWLRAPLTIEEQRILEGLASGQQPTEEDIRTLCQGFAGDCRVTQSIRYNTGRPKRDDRIQRKKRFVIEFINALMNPNGIIPIQGGRNAVNSDANWTPRIPSISSSEREQQNIYVINSQSSGYPKHNPYLPEQPYPGEYNAGNQNYKFNEETDAMAYSRPFNEYNINSRFNEYNNENGREGGWIF